MTDKLINCKKCGSKLCYETQVNLDITNYACMGCGFYTNTLMKEGEEFYNTTIETLPELFKEIIYTDDEGFKWSPTVVNVEDKGLVFPNGTSKDNWQWCGVLSIPVSEEEKTKYPIKGKPGQYYKYRMDMTTLKPFGKEGYMDALKYIGVI